MRREAAKAVAWVFVLLGSACGGGGPTVAGPATPTRPDIVLLLVSGHQGLFDTVPSESYLHLDAGPEIEGDLRAAGLTVASAYYVDDALTVDGYGGYYELVADMQYVRDTWAPLGSRTVLVAHSHGGVWAHAAVRAVPGLTVTCQVDLDCSSYGWGTVLHDLQNGAIGGDPREAYDIGFVVTPSSYPSVPSEQTGIYDLEDTVFANVAYDLDVRSGDIPVLFEWYDEVWNIRLNGTTTGLYHYYSGSTHEAVHATGSTTLAVVRSWLRARLGV